MGAWAPVVGMIGVVLVIGTTLVLRGPVGRALAEWIRSWSAHDAQWLAEVEERLDFAERLLPRDRPADRLAPPPQPRDVEGNPPIPFVFRGAPLFPPPISPPCTPAPQPHPPPRRPPP